MNTFTKDFTFTIGDTKRLAFWYKDATTGEYITLSDHECWMTLKINPTDEDDAPGAIQKVKSQGGMVIDDLIRRSGQSVEIHSSCRAVVRFAPSETKNFNPAGYVYDFQVKTAAGDIYTLYKGQIKTVPEITKAS